MRYKRNLALVLGALLVLNVVCLAQEGNQAIETSSIKTNNDPAMILAHKSYDLAVGYSKGAESAEVIADKIVSECQPEILAAADYLAKGVASYLPQADREALTEKNRVRDVEHYSKMAKETSMAVVHATREKTRPFQVHMGDVHNTESGQKDRDAWLKSYYSGANSDKSRGSLPDETSSKS